jgi:hypothetical protein
MGADGMIYGAKVINIGNHRRYKVFPKEDKHGNKLKPTCTLQTVKSALSRKSASTT